MNACVGEPRLGVEIDGSSEAYQSRGEHLRRAALLAHDPRRRRRLRVDAVVVRVGDIGTKRDVGNGTDDRVQQCHPRIPTQRATRGIVPLCRRDVPELQRVDVARNDRYGPGPSAALSDVASGSVPTMVLPDGPVALAGSLWWIYQDFHPLGTRRQPRFMLERR